VQRVTELVQDPRPVEEKQQVVLQVRVQRAWRRWPVGVVVVQQRSPRVQLPGCHNAAASVLWPQEVEDTLVTFLERGATVETDILANLKTLLPPEVSAQLDEIIPPPPNAAGGSRQPWQQQQYEGGPPSYDGEPPVTQFTADSVLESQIGEWEWVGRCVLERA
jgi:hypothetical protein